MKNVNLLWMLLFCFGWIGQVSAQSSMNYEQWKARQQQHDLRLKQQPSPQNYQQRVIQVEPVKTATTISTQAQVLGEKITVNVNTADIQELTAKLDGIGRKKAQAILDYRQQQGGFKKVDDLLHVKGIGEKTLAKNRARIVLN